MVETLDLNSNDETMTPIENMLQPPPANPEPEKNINKEVNMDSTPISDLMGQQEVFEQPPQMMSSTPMMPTQAVMAPAPAPAPAQAPAPAVSKYPGNLTEEQIEALVVAASAVLAFSKPVQERVAGMVPNFLDAEGSRSMVGMVVTGLIAAIIFYFARRMVVKN